MSKYHYTYRITNLVEQKHYYGVRSSKCTPEKDLGFHYFSSSSVKSFLADQKSNPVNYKYKIISVHSSRIEAVAKEMKLHNKLDVANNKSFYNLAKQTSTGWDVSGNKEICKKISIATKKCFSDPEFRERHRLACLGRKHPKKQNERHSKCMTGSKNPAAKKIYIFDENGVLQYACHGNFRKTCAIENLPIGAFKKSLRFNGTPIYQTNMAKSSAKRNGFVRFIGWYVTY